MITLTPALIAQVEETYRFSVEDATAFGVVWKQGLTPFLPDVETATLSEREAAILLALDLLLTNGDRTEPNPNVCWDRERLLVFDFEHCLELPRSDHARRRSLHLDSLQPLWETHLVARWVPISSLVRATADLLKGMRIDALKREAFALPLSWFADFMDNLEYLGYLKHEPEPFLSRIQELSR